MIKSNWHREHKRPDVNEIIKKVDGASNPVHKIVILRWKWLSLFVLQVAIIAALVTFTTFRNPMFYYINGCIGLMLLELQRIKNDKAR